MILFILLLALLMRLAALNQSFWLDEAVNVLAARDNTFWSMLTKYPIGDFHPPGYFAVLWVWDHIFGYSEITSRLTSVIFGVLTVYLTYLIGKKLISRRVGTLGALLLAVNPLHLYYSQEARMYSFAALAGSLSFYFFIDLLRGGKFKGLRYALSVGLILYSDYLAYFIIPVQIILGYICLKPAERNKFFGWLAVGMAFLIPWLIIFPEQFASGQAARALSGWSTVVGGATVKDFLLLPVKMVIGKISLANKLVYGLVLGLVSLPYLYLILNIVKTARKVKVLLLWLLFPPAAAFLISIFIPVFSYFRFIFIIPAFSLLLAYAASELEGVKGWFVIGLIALSSLGASLIYLTNPQFQRENWRGVASFISSNRDNLTLIVFEDNGVFAPYKYYAGDLSNTVGGLDRVPAQSMGDVTTLEGQVRNKTKIYLFDYLVDITDRRRLLKQEIFQLGFKEIKEYDFSGVGIVTLYHRS